MSLTLNISGRTIGKGHAPYVICELSANHNGSLNQALKMIDVAADTGADAIKIQTYKPDTITLDASTDDFVIQDGLWKGRRLYDLYEEAQTPFEWHKPLFDRARERRITLFSSPFDFSAVDLLEDLGAPAYKVASFECVDLPLIRYIASTEKPMIISTGMADESEISEAVEAAREGGCKELALLLCVSGYPAPAADYNLATIPDMVSRFNVPVGLSDHTLDNTTAIASVALGGSLIEKHFTLDRNAGGPDDSFSLEPQEFATLCSSARTAWEAMGQVDYGQKSSERSNVKFRRSLYFLRDLKAGETIGANDVRSVRPGFGVAPKHLDKIVGQTLVADVSAATPVTIDVLSDGIK